MTCYNRLQLSNVTLSWLLSGEQDVFLPPQKLHAKAKQFFPQLHSTVIADAGHLLLEEQPQQVLAQVLDFLDPQGR